MKKIISILFMFFVLSSNVFSFDQYWQWQDNTGNYTEHKCKICGKTIYVYEGNSVYFDNMNSSIIYTDNEIANKYQPDKILICDDCLNKYKEEIESKYNDILNSIINRSENIKKREINNKKERDKMIEDLKKDQEELKRKIDELINREESEIEYSKYEYKIEVYDKIWQEIPVESFQLNN